MKKVGLLCGREYSFPPAFIVRVNQLGKPDGVAAEFVKLGGTCMNEPAEYSVIVDRISHEVEYYRGYLKHAVLQGVTGHTLGAAGAIEAAYTLLAVERDEVPPTANLATVDADIPIDVVSGSMRSKPVRAAMSNSFGFGGHNAVLVLTAA